MDGFRKLKLFTSPVKTAKTPETSEEPLRAELLSIEQLEQHAVELARQHKISAEPGPDLLLKRLAENERILVNTHKATAEAAAEGQEMSPADRWFLDNFYLIKEQINSARQHLPKNYSRELPRICEGPMTGYPRVYDIVFDLISHVDGRADIGCFISFISGYQSEATLKMGELWAIPIMLRLALIENLRRIMAGITASRNDWSKAAEWANKLMLTAQREPGHIILTMAEMTRTAGIERTPFIAEFSRRMQGQGPAFAFTTAWIQQRLAEKGLTIEQVVQDENRRQAANQVSVANSINSMRFVDEMDWHSFIETVSIVENVLREEECGVYERIDFASRDAYRHVIEDISRKSRLTEIEIARAAVRLANESAPDEKLKNRTSHVGYYLADKGRQKLERYAGVSVSFFRKTLKRIAAACRNCSLALYLGAILLITVLITGELLIPAAEQVIVSQRYPLFIAIVSALCLFTLLAVSQIAIELVNRMVTLLVKPRYLPRMDFSKGIPSNARTLVIVPTILENTEDIEKLLHQMEIRYMGNRDEHLHFALLTDFCDAPAESMPEDKILLDTASKGIEALNKKYGHERRDIFFLFHRPRKFNPRERAWMGHERKRGKIADLNAFLRGKASDSFSKIIGNARILRKVKYVITLDTDTQLPSGAANQLVSVAEHPLNRPVFDERSRIITEGYGILQPRVGISILSANRSLFSQFFSGDPRFDPYTRAISDVYQDLFGKGSFIGKGLYDVDTFNNVMEGRLPENRILSHDLLEGCHAATALVSDVLLYEEFPATYSADANRRHRWIRGDWQIAAWLFPYVPGPGGTRLKNPLSALSRWKILDNLRRSLVPPALVLMLITGWFATGHFWLWTAVTAGIILGPSLLSASIDLFRKTYGLTLKFRFRETSHSVGRYVIQTAFNLVFLPYEAFICMDAISKTMTRLLFTRRGLLQWTTAKAAEKKALRTHDFYWKTMWISPSLSICVTFYLTVIRLMHPAAFALLIPWLLCPSLAWRISLDRIRRKSVLPAYHTAFLRKLARKTWFFFETFDGTASNLLIPDNFQEVPVEKTAPRTSPTNIGFSLTASLAAYDFGYLSAGKLIKRTEGTFDAMKQMDRFHGHFYNWYDTRTLQPLHPKYVSTVDSGNLQFFLMILRQGLLELPYRELLPSRAMEGLADTLNMFLDAVEQSLHSNMQSMNSILDAAEKLVEIRDRMESTPPALGRIKEIVTATLSEIQRAAVIMDVPEESEINIWARSVENLCIEFLEEISLLAPWTEITPVTKLPEDKIAKEPADEMKKLFARLENMPTLHEIAGTGSAVLSLIDRITHTANAEDAGETPLHNLRLALSAAVERAQKRIAVIENLAAQCAEFADMEYGFLYNKSRNLLAIGFNAEEHRRDIANYDLLASESRLASFLLISRGILPTKHWFSLGRLVTAFNGEPVLLSWSGSLFEYLMPLLVMTDYENTLLNQTYRTVVDWQIKYGADRRIPWGFSESGYNAVDANKNYLYSAFGIPGLGFKRGLANNIVVAPYASALALMVKPENACRNLERLAKEDATGKYGFYEAVDYTRARLVRGESKAVVRSFMAHHQGMTLLAAAYTLLDRPMQKRFESDTAFKAAELLLQEKIPDVKPFFPNLSEDTGTRDGMEQEAALMRIFNTPDTPSPEVHLLSNGRYQVMVTNAGGGYSRWKDLAVTRWREDATCDDIGTFCYVQETDTGESWSIGFHPARKTSKNYEAIFSQARAEFRRQDGQFRSHAEIAVSPEEDVEIRRISITNGSRKPRTLKITSYAEIVLASPDAEASHPAFNGLFMETEILKDRQAILCMRRPRSEKETPVCLAHLAAVRNAVLDGISYETDRARFIGRGRTLRNPAAVHDAEKLSDSEGAVLDPVTAIQVNITIEPEETAAVDLVFGIARTREEAVSLAARYHDKYIADRIFALAWTHSQVVLHQLGITEPDAQLFGRLAGALLYVNPMRRAGSGLLSKNLRSQSELWGYGISGDLPIVLLRIGDESKIDMVRQLIDAHAYWRVKGLSADLIIWNEDQSGYRQLLHDRITSMASAGTASPAIESPGGIFVRRSDQISDEDKILMQAAARIVITDTDSLAEQIERKPHQETNVPDLKTSRFLEQDAPEEKLPSRSLIFNNGTGGFTQDGREYVITTTTSRQTPMPWVNILANPHFGTVISESGTAYTWNENAHEFRITPWYNDPVTDVGGEAFYIRDEETGRFWSPTPLPARGKTPYVSRHGFGYSVFEHTDRGISSEMWTYAATEAPVKFISIRIRSNSARKRKISVTGYAELVLGESRKKTQMHVVTGIDPESRAFFAHNPFSIEFPRHTVFFEVSAAQRSVTGDRTEFIGRNRNLASPAAMHRTKLSGKTGAGMDPCAALQVRLELKEGEEKEIVFILGAAKNKEAARAFVRQFRDPAAARKELEKVWEYWNHTLGTINVETPDKETNIMVNGWLLYQTLASRIYARSGFYQSSGAMGFRDQLQDIMALVHAEPYMVRKHILLCASRQFKEGDVQHWWHPPAGRGVRTRISDDYLWLPFVTHYYVNRTGDTGILDETAGFLSGRPLNPNETDYYDLPEQSDETGTLYEHCVRAIKNALRYGKHGLPLIGSGDWNDSLDKVGEKGEGESVWLGFFLYAVLTRFGKLAKERGDENFAQTCLEEAEKLKASIDRHGWDGQWYRRAYFDDGKPLGSSENDECRIDSISQSWSLLSGAGDPRRARTAMESLKRFLVRREDGIILLLDPPFNKSGSNPGYIKGYLPGVRENGSQYTHAAVWTVMALAEMGEAQEAWELFKMINPVSHGSTPEAMQIYKTEPYVVAADVYSVPPLAGRGGWTWYTGSAGWMYRLIVETLMGLHLHGNVLQFQPHIPSRWDSFKVHYRYKETVYHIVLTKTGTGEGIAEVTVDGVKQEEKNIRLTDDRKEHEVEVAME